MGAWISYGIGCETEDPPAFVVMTSSSGGGQPLYDRLWGNGFLTSRYQGVKFRSVGDPCFIFPTSMDSRLPTAASISTLSTGSPVSIRLWQNHFALV
jgi:hypothetical protein